jgi:hypothetical protein
MPFSKRYTVGSTRAAVLMATKSVFKTGTVTYFVTRSGAEVEIKIGIPLASACFLSISKGFVHS